MRSCASAPSTLSRRIPESRRTFFPIRLSRLVNLGILRQTTAEEPGRTGAYALTEKGIDLYPVLLAIQAWADDWVRDRLRSPLRLQHRTCGTALRLMARCDRCAEPVNRANAELRIV